MMQNYNSYGTPNNYTTIIPNYTKDFSKQISELASLWFSVTKKRIIDYGTNGIRKTSWIPPKGYTFSLFKEKGINLEILQQENSHCENVILMVHGGSFIYRMHDGFMNLMPQYSKAGHGITVVSVDYRVVPEFTYKDMIDDVLTSYKWLLEKGYTPANIIMAGDSSGGYTVLSTLLYMRDKGYELPAGVITLSASSNINANTKSYHYNKNVDVFFRNNNLWLDTLNIIAKRYNRNNPYISPFYGDFKGFPPMLMQVGGSEMLLNDSSVIAENAYKQGVDVRLEIYEKMFHDFQNMKGSLIEADIAWENIGKFIEEIFQH